MMSPREGWRHAKVTDHHAAIDYARVLKFWPIYEAFPAAEARRLVERFEWRYTPKHGRWLDLAESELGVLFLPVSRPPHSR
jgi:hypothetical protein